MILHWGLSVKYVEFLFEFPSFSLPFLMQVFQLVTGSSKHSSFFAPPIQGTTKSSERKDAMSDVQDMVQQQIKDHKVMVFSKTYCPYCKKAKNVLAKYNIKSQDYGVLELDTLSDSGQADAIQQYMKSLTGASSVSP